MAKPRQRHTFEQALSLDQVHDFRAAARRAKNRMYARDSRQRHFPRRQAEKLAAAAIAQTLVQDTDALTSNEPAGMCVWGCGGECCVVLLVWYARTYCTEWRLC